MLTFPVPACRVRDEALAVEPTVTTLLPVVTPVPAPMFMVCVFVSAVLALPMLTVLVSVDCPSVIVPVPDADPTE